MTDKTGNPIRTCFQINGTKKKPVEIQSVLPDLKDFKVSYVFYLFIYYFMH